MSAITMTQKLAPKKMWSSSRKIEKITPSKYEKNEASIKTYWRNYVADLELSYKDDKFWESQAGAVRSIVPAATYRKLAKMYNLPVRTKPYYPTSEASCSPAPSLQYYKSKTHTSSARQSRMRYSMSDFESEVSLAAASSDHSSLSRDTTSPPSTMRSSRMLLRSSVKSLQQVGMPDDEELASTLDDLIVHCGDKAAATKQRKHREKKKETTNPHHDMLRTNKSETDMITWKSKYKTKGPLELSSADEFSKKAQIVSKQIAMDFFEWYSAMGEVEFKSELKCPGDIEQLFQVWFDEHASRGLVLDPKIMTCVLQSVANGCGLPKASCPNVLKRQVNFDIKAESTPLKAVAFGTALPHTMKHIPPDNQTAKIWSSVRAPEDLRTMSCVWDEIKHLSSTKVFERWLSRRPLLSMPPCLKGLGRPAGKQLFVVPSDFVMRTGSDSSEEDLALPVSQLNIELKSVLSKLMN